MKVKRGFMRTPFCVFANPFLVFAKVQWLRTGDSILRPWRLVSVDKNQKESVLAGTRVGPRMLYGLEDVLRFCP